MSSVPSSKSRVGLDGKFFRLGGRKFYVKGIAYGPFAPDAGGSTFADPGQTRRDFALMQQLGANTVRLYHAPPPWLPDLAGEHDLKLFVDLSWNQHHCFLSSVRDQAEARTAVREATRQFAGHPAILALSVANEIPPDVVRWSGPAKVARFMDHLVEEVKTLDAELLCTYGNFPPTEYLRPEHVDFYCFNVYLHEQQRLDNYLARLQMIAGSKPLLLGECGVDSIREGDARQGEMLSWQIETAFRGGLAGVCVFSFTDDWFRGGSQVTDWAMGLTTRERVPKPAFARVQEVFARGPHFPLPSPPKVSVVVACYNGESTLRNCLDSLSRLHYPDYEVILVDDGSTDATPRIAADFSGVRVVRQPNRGLSVARNTGIAAATGEIVAFTDADCRADEDWLYYLAGTLITSPFVGAGGPNLLPPEDSRVSAAVMASPGGPAHVMLDDRVAEHVPGCNMAFYKWALQEVGGFDPVFRKAGDDVDICWRLQERGYQIGFNPAGFVWHHRRSTVAAYLRQQQGYGEAEAILARKHPAYFNAAGGSVWTGRIYHSHARRGIRAGKSIIYHGVFGGAMFQCLYEPPPAGILMLLTSLEYHVLVTLPLFVLSAPFRFVWPLALASLFLSIGLCTAAAWQASVPPKQQAPWSRLLVALLHFLQPIMRGLARYQERLIHRPTPLASREKLDSMALADSGESLAETQYWSEHRMDRVDFIRGILTRLETEGWPFKPDSGWEDYDVEIYGGRWSTLQLITAAEVHAQGRQLFRCHLKPGWSLPAKVLLGLALAIELLIIGWISSQFAWIWLLLLTVPALAWYLSQEQRNLQRLMVVLLDEVAKSQHMIKVKPASPANRKSAPADKPAATGSRNDNPF